jgi:hypothetical protein
MSILTKYENHDFGLGEQASLVCIVTSLHGICLPQFHLYYGRPYRSGVGAPESSNILETNSSACFFTAARTSARYGQKWGSPFATELILQFKINGNGPCCISFLY